MNKPYVFDQRTVQLKKLLRGVFQHGFTMAPKNFVLELAGHGNFSRSMKETLGKILPDDVGYIVRGDTIYFVRFDNLVFPSHVLHQAANDR